MDKVSLIVTLVAIVLLIAILVYITFTIKKSHENKPDFGNQKPDEVPWQTEVIGDDNSVPDENENPKPNCDIEPEPEPLDHNLYVFGIHKYISAIGKEGYCVVCNAVIKCHNYRVICKYSFCPNLSSYTDKVVQRIKNAYSNDKLTVEEFMNSGYSNFDRVGSYVRLLDDNE